MHSGFVSYSSNEKVLQTLVLRFMHTYWICGVDYGEKAQQ